MVHSKNQQSYHPRTTSLEGPLLLIHRWSIRSPEEASKRVSAALDKVPEYVACEKRPYPEQPYPTPH